MTYYPSTRLVQQFFDDNGVPLSGGKLNAYLAGTTTPTNMFTDAAGTVAGTTITLNARGEPAVSGNTVVIWLDSNIDYKFTLQNASLSSIWTVSLDNEVSPFYGSAIRTVDSITALKALDKTEYDRIYLTGYYSAGDGGGGHFWYDSSDTTSADDGGIIIVATDGARWKRVFSGAVNVRWFGAKGDGTTDDTAIIQGALDYANTNNIGEVFLPAGDYLVGNINWPGNNLTLRGSGCGYSYNSSADTETTLKAKAATTIVLDLVQTGIAEDRTGNHIVDLEIDGNSIATVGIDCAGSNIIERVRVRGCTTAGVRLSNFTNSTRVIRCGLNQNSGWGLQATGVSATTYSVTDCNISLNTLGGVDLQTGVCVYFQNTVIESNDGPGLRLLRPNVHTNAMDDFLFENCWFEDNGETTPFYTLVIDAETEDPTYGPQHVRFKGCRINTSSATRKYANINVTKWAAFQDCQFDASTQSDALTLSSNAEYVSFINSSVNTWFDGITPTQMDNALAQGNHCWWHDTETKRVVGSGSPAAAFENSWVNHSATFPDTAYWFDIDGNVCVEGAVKSGSSGTTVFTLPVGYRPARRHHFVVDANGAYGRIIVDADGTVDVDPGSGTITHLSGVKFGTS